MKGFVTQGPLPERPVAGGDGLTLKEETADDYRWNGL